jgi:hypothetical protein
MESRGTVSGVIFGVKVAGSVHCESNSISSEFEISFSLFLSSSYCDDVASSPTQIDTESMGAGASYILLGIDSGIVAGKFRDQFFSADRATSHSNRSDRCRE